MPDDLESLAEAYFVHELGLDPDAIEEASENLLGYFRTLQGIQDRLEAEDKPL